MSTLEPLSLLAAESLHANKNWKLQVIRRISTFLVGLGFEIRTYTSDCLGPSSPTSGPLPYLSLLTES